MTRLKEEVVKKIEKAVNKYIKSFDTKDEKGIKTGNSLIHEPEVLQAFLKSGIMVGLTREVRLHAKTYFKENLPYKEWVISIRTDPQKLANDMLHFRKLQEEEY